MFNLFTNLINELEVIKHFLVLKFQTDLCIPWKVGYLGIQTNPSVFRHNFIDMKNMFSFYLENTQFEETIQVSSLEHLTIIIRPKKWIGKE